mmetsp:Transcript_48936/g.137694  ORF Transcript_48936/g.137694 Transcript_48936/m.137694 type:complete len:277 (+) Transcript_48936:129-959(+)
MARFSAASPLVGSALAVVVASLVGDAAAQVHLVSAAASGNLRGVAGTDADEAWPVARGDGRPDMDNIETMRAEKCWDREKILEHKKCLDWMLEACPERNSRTGRCVALQELLMRKCREGGPLSKVACKLAKAVGLDVDPPKEEEKEDDVEAKLEDSAEAVEDGAKAITDSLGDLPVPGGEEEEEEEEEERHAKKEAKPVKKHAANTSDPGEGLPDQGFNEHSTGNVEHKDAETYTGDWGKEWPMSHETEGETRERICREHPELTWCDLYLHMRKHG